jgi:hypothetical protein
VYHYLTDVYHYLPDQGAPDGKPTRPTG